MRAEVLREREALGDETRKSLSKKILREIKSLDEYARAGTILAYSGFGSELQTGEFLKNVIQEGKTLVLPRIAGEGGKKELRLHVVEDLARDLRAGTWGILEPEEDLPRLDVSDVDFALIPGVAFDRRGGRLGHGGGFYDRLLGFAERLPHLVAGAFDAQIVEEAPKEPHDVILDLVVTESSRFVRAEDPPKL